MQKIMFNERYGLQSAVLDGRKKQTRREPFFSDVEIEMHLVTGKFFVIEKDSRKLIHTSRYAIGEKVAIAQSYSSIFDEAYDDYFNDKYSSFRNGNLTESKGWKNKMFVSAELMPHHIKILDIRCERLQDISKDDSVCEGIYMRFNEKENRLCWCYNDSVSFGNPQFAFRMLIGKLNGKKFWDSNPYVIVYKFEKID